MVRCAGRCPSRPVRPSTSPPTSRRRRRTRAAPRAPTPRPPRTRRQLAPALVPPPAARRRSRRSGVMLFATGPRRRGWRRCSPRFGLGFFVALAIRHAGVERRRRARRRPRRAQSRGAGPPRAPLGCPAAGVAARARSTTIPTPPTSTSSATPRSSSSPGPCTRRPGGGRWRRGCCRSIEATLAGVRDRQAAVAELAPALDFRQDLTLAARATPHDAGAARARRLRRLGRRRQLAAGAAVDPDRSRWRSASRRRAGALLYYAEWIRRPVVRHHRDARLAAARLGADAARGDQRRRRRRARAARLVGAGAPRQRTALAEPAARRGRTAVLEGGHVRGALRTLEQGVALADFRLSTWLYLPVQTLTLWDLHVWWGLERWRRRHGRHVRGWLEAIGRVEALAALASLAHDHPQWAFPTLHDTPAADGAAPRRHRARPRPPAPNGRASPTTSRSDRRAASCWSPARTCRARAR